MTPKEAAAKFAAENPEAAALLRAEGHATGAAAELERVKAVRAAALPGHEALIDALAADGKTSGAEAALAVIASERGKTAAAVAARAADAQPPVQTAPVQAEPTAAATAAPKGYRAGDRVLSVDAAAAKLDAAAKAYMAAHPGASYIQAIKAVSTQEA